jgi:hypothetical protein
LEKVGSHLGQQKREKLGVGWDMDFKWIPKGEGIWYLGVQIGFRLPTQTNFDRMMLALKGKLINWGHNNLSLAGKILVANQVFLASMWYLAACWNLNPRMCSQVRGVVRNFIWSNKVARACAKVKWDTLSLPTPKGNLGIIDPKTQFEALLAKLHIRGLTCRNLSFGLATKAKGLQGFGPRESPGVTSYTFDSVRKCEGV